VWALIESSGKTRPNVTDDVIFVSGAYPRPIIGRQKFAPKHTGMANAEAEMRKRSGEVVETHPEKVVVSKAGDMAYGFASFNMEFDRPDSAGKSEHVKFEGSQLTVWRKIGGENGASRLRSIAPTIESSGPLADHRLQLPRACAVASSSRTGRAPVQAVERGLDRGPSPAARARLGRQANEAGSSTATIRRATNPRNSRLCG
jgi:ketosteroid isomerase-like protein